jgi:hypothetical protein
MTINQKQDKLDKRAAALRENLRKRKPAKKPAKPAKTEKKDNE